MPRTAGVMPFILWISPHGTTVAQYERCRAQNETRGSGGKVCMQTKAKSKFAPTRPVALLISVDERRLAVLFLRRGTDDTDQAEWSKEQGAGRWIAEPIDVKAAEPLECAF